MSAPLTYADSVARAKERVFTVGFAGTGPAADFIATGTADNVPINAAITAANAAGGGIVELGAGTYALAAPVVMLSNVVLRGVGFATRLRVNNATSINAIQGQTVSNVSIRDMQIDGNQANNTDPGGSLDANQCNINIWNASQLEVCGVYSHDAIYHGIFVRDQTGVSKNVNIHHNWLYNNGYRPCHIHGQTTPSSIAMTEITVSDNVCYTNGQQAGALARNAGIFVLFNNAKHVIVANNVIHDEIGWGIAVTGVLAAADVAAEKCVIVGNTVSACRGVLVGSGVKKTIIANNVISASTSHGLAIENNVASAPDSFDLVVTGNVITNGAARGINVGNDQVGGMRSLNFSGNTISDNAGAGIYFANLGNISNISITSNVIRANGVEGIRMIGGGSYTARSVLIEGNQITESTDRGIYLTSVDHFVIKGNTLVDNFSGSGATIQLLTCTYGLIEGNTGGGVAKTLTGSFIQTGSNCSEITVSGNEGYGINTVVNANTVTNIRILDNFGTGQIFIDSTATNVHARDNRTTASPYLTNNSTTAYISRRVSPPATATSTGRLGDEAFDASGNIYRCTATNTWVRATLATF